MNSLIILHNKYPKNSPIKKNNNKYTMDFDGNKSDKFNNSFEKNKEENKIKMNSYHMNTPNNIFDLSYIKNKNLYNYSDSKNNMEKFFHSYKRATKRTYLEAFSKYKNQKNNNDKSNVVNLNINNNNYFYINNNMHNINDEEEYNIDFSKNKRFKE